MKNGKIVLLNGVSSSGKSTLAKHLAEHLPDYLLLSLDDIGKLIFQMRNKKLKPPTSEIAFYSNYKLPLKPYLFHRIIRLIHDYSYNIIVDAVIDNRDVAEDINAIFDKDDIIYVAVLCPIEELERRERVRGDRPIGLAKSQVESFHTNNKYDVEVDTFNNTLDECVEKIVNFINKGDKT